MQVKIFQASGQGGIADLEAEINRWSGAQHSIKFVETAMCQVGEADGERFQHYVVSVWYVSARSSS